MTIRIAIFLVVFFLHACGAAPAIKVLLFSGQNNHDWRQTTPQIKSILEKTGRFTVTITDHPEKTDPESLSQFDVLLSNWNGWGKNAVTNWPAALKDAYISFVRNGKGLVVVHAGSSSFYDWPEYQQISLGSWNLPKTGHGPVHEFDVRIADAKHPVTVGMTPFRIRDELWHRTGFQPGVTVLATAFSAKSAGGSNADEPVAVAAEPGKGRSFYLVLGHDAKTMQSDGFSTLLIRGAEWAATGRVTAETSRKQP